MDIDKLTFYQITQLREIGNMFLRNGKCITCEWVHVKGLVDEVFIHNLTDEELTWFCEAIARILEKTGAISEHIKPVQRLEYAYSIISKRFFLANISFRFADYALVWYTSNVIITSNAGLRLAYNTLV